jgi:iron(III) transport system ATP-binding protein
MLERHSGEVRTSAPHLRVRNLTKTFGDFTALRDVSLDLDRGEFVCFLGPSGCGKTTLLRIIAGLDAQDTGTVEIGSRDVSHVPPKGRDFGIVFQSYALFPNLSVRRNVAYGLMNRGLPRAEMNKRVTDLLALVGLPEQADKYPVQLSGGQQQRVALARALATEPSLLLLDEPLSALDARVRANLRSEIKQLHRRLGVTTIMVTHDQEEALAMADRIVVMDQGQLVQSGTPIEIYTRPASQFVADFVGSTNMLEATVTAAGRISLGKLALAIATPDGTPAPAPGTRVRVGLRPEDVRVRGLEPASANRVRVSIEMLEFLGPFARARLRPIDDPQQTILADFSANALRDLGLAEQQEIDIALPPDALRLFPVTAPTQP